jgi:hypothetical protein
MELTEKERLMLVEKKAEIRKLTEHIFDLTVDLEKNRVEIKKKVSGILSLLSVIISYTNSKNNLVLPLIAFAQQIFYLIDSKPCLCKTTTSELEFFCNTVNSIRFNFTKKDLKINIPKVDISIFKSG